MLQGVSSLSLPLHCSCTCSCVLHNQALSSFAWWGYTKAVCCSSCQLLGAPLRATVHPEKQLLPLQQKLCGALF